MTRKEFLIRVWRKLLIPIVQAITLIFLAYFLYDVINGGSARGLLLVILALCFLFLVFDLIGRLIKYTQKKLHFIIPQPIMIVIERYRGIFDFALTILLGALIYHTWLTDQFFALACFIFILIEKIIDLSKSAKSDESRLS